MTNEVVAVNPLSLIQEVDVKLVSETLTKVKSLQATLKSILVDKHDYGTIPGCGDKPTLLKPGAEKILMALGITSSYELIEHTENFEGKGFFAYTVKCILFKNGQKITEGLGHANSKEKKWAIESVYEKDLPEGTDKSLLRKKQIKTKNGETFYKYEVDADVNSKANTILKMAKKRSQIDAVLTVASLSEIFTQDFDDIEPTEEPTSQPVVEKVKEDIKSTPEYYCEDCGAGVTPKVYEYSKKQYGRPLCISCQRNAGGQ